MSAMLQEIKTVLRGNPESFVRFCQPLTVRVQSGPIRDRAVGLYNYLLDVHIFLLNAPETSHGIYAVMGPLLKGDWHCWQDQELYDLYAEQLCQNKANFQYMMDMDEEVGGPA